MYQNLQACCALGKSLDCCVVWATGAILLNGHKLAWFFSYIPPQKMKGRSGIF